MLKAFSGVRILDFTHVVSGPFGSYQLALQGADVIKVEPRGGEEIRRGAVATEWGRRGYAPGWAAVNGNKKSITLDLKKPEAIEIIKSLALTADVVMENFRPDVMDKLGIGYQGLSAVNDRLIYCAITGFGQDGPERNTPAFDAMIQATSGMMSLTGHPETGPVRTGFAAADVITGLTASFAISAALFQRSQTGKGQFVDVAMLDATMSLMALQLTDCMLTGHIPEPIGNRAMSLRPTADMFSTRDGDVLVAAGTEKQYTRFMCAIGRPDVVGDERFTDWQLRIANRAALRSIIEDAMRGESTVTWISRFKEADIPCSGVLNVRQALDNPQLKHRRVIQDIEGPLGSMSLIGPGFKLAHGDGGVECAPPLPGQHTAEVLMAIGYSPAQVAALHENEVI